MGAERTGGAGSAGRLDDDALLAELGGLLDRVDPPPAWLQDLARLGYGLRSVDLELAELVADSQVEEPALAVRGAAARTEPRLLSFEAEGLLIDLQISPGAVGIDLAGQLVPTLPAAVELRQPDRPVRRVQADRFGRFTLEALSDRPFSLVVVRPGMRPVASSWVASG